MNNLSEKHPTLTDILQPPLKQENPVEQEQNLSLVSNANNAQFNLHPSTPPVSPYTFNQRHQMMSPRFHMQHPMDPIRTVLAFQAQENIASRRDTAERQAHVNQVLVDVTKMLLKEQENNRNFQKEIIEMFATKLSEHCAKLTAPAPATQAPVPVATSPVRDSTAGTSGGGPSYSPHSRKRKYPSVTANKKVIGKGKGYDETTQSYTSFVCNFCPEELPNRRSLRKHSEEMHPNV